MKLKYRYLLVFLLITGCGNDLVGPTTLNVDLNKEEVGFLRSFDSSDFYLIWSGEFKNVSEETAVVTYSLQITSDTGGKKILYRSGEFSKVVEPNAEVEF